MARHDLSLCLIRPWRVPMRAAPIVGATWYRFNAQGCLPVAKGYYRYVEGLGERGI
jgi:hypothetical protein